MKAKSLGVDAQGITFFYGAEEIPVGLAGVRGVRLVDGKVTIE